MTSLKVNSALAATIVLWASAFVGIRYGLTAYSPGSLALLRFIVASFSMAVIYRSMKIKKSVQWMDRLQLLFLGMVGIGLYNICLNYGEMTVSAGMASFIIGLMPVMTIIMSVFFLKEQQGMMVWFGVAVSFLGLFIIILGEQTQVQLSGGVWIIVISAFTGAVYSLMSRHYLQRYHPVAVTSWIIWGGTLMLMMFFPALAGEILQANSQATLAVIYMGVFPAALAYVAWSYVLNHLPASNAAMYLYGLPIVSTLMGFIFLHEMPSLLSFIGGLIALAGAFIANRFRLSQSLKTNHAAIGNISSAKV